VGTAVTLSGSGFIGATSVKFNGTSATTFTVSSDTQVTATVPSGATSGTISVTTPGGTATSATSFSVTSPGLAVVQVQNNVDLVNTDTSLTVPITTTAGNLLVAFAREGPNAADNFTVTDSAGQTWFMTKSGYENESSTGPRIGMFYVANSKAVTSVTVNYTTSGGVTKPSLMVMEISGAALSGVEDALVNNKSGASATTETSGSLTTMNANDILIFAGDAAGTETSWTAGAGYTIPNNKATAGVSGSNARTAMQYLIVSSTQTNARTSMTYSNANWNGNIFAAFK